MGYGCIAYLRLPGVKSHTLFLFDGESRLTPTKVVTVPRIELTTATISVRMGQMLYEELEVKPETITYHTNSPTVLWYIGNEQKRFQIFVANRVQLIRDFTCRQRANQKLVALRGYRLDFQPTEWQPHG